MIGGIRDKVLVAAAIAMLMLAAALIGTRTMLSQCRASAAAERAGQRETAALHRIAAADAQARAAARLVRVGREQADITKEIADDYQTRLADARARANALRVSVERGRAGPDGGGAHPLSKLSDAADRTDAAADDGLSVDQRLTATDQAIQLDALIAWITAQAAVDPNADEQP